MVKTYLSILVNDAKGFWSDGTLLYSSPVRWQRRAWSFFACCAVLLVLCLFLDEPVRHTIALLHGQYQDSMFSFGHWYGQGTATLWLFLILYFLGLVAGKDRPRLLGLSIGKSYLLSGVLTIGLKSLLGRWRPYTGHGSLAFAPFTPGPNEHLSFPSGHVTVAFALSSVMAGAFSSGLWKASWYLFAVLTALSRVYQDDHWFSDVICSAFIGIAVGMWLTQHRRLEPHSVGDRGA